MKSWSTSSIRRVVGTRPLPQNVPWAARLLPVPSAGSAAALSKSIFTDTGAYSGWVHTDLAAECAERHTFSFAREEIIDHVDLVLVRVAERNASVGYVSRVYLARLTSTCVDSVDCSPITTIFW